MFRFFAAQGATPMTEISVLHPSVIEALLERAWNARLDVGGPTPLGHPDRRSDVPGRPNPQLDPILSQAAPGVPPGTTVNVPALDGIIRGSAPSMRWHHLIYAYMIENTRVLEVFRAVIDAFLHGERLSVLSAPSQRWLWTTEELFFRDPPSFSVSTQTSAIRPHLAATRANAYHRLFGMTLNPVGGQRTPFTAAEHANADFVAVFDEFLHEIWQGRSNFANAVGARPTDDAKIAELATRLCDMLRSRRVNGTLSREEFTAVSTMAWFHATLDTDDHPVVVDLRAQATSAEERLFKIAQRVGVPAHGLTKSFFEIAEPISRLLIAIEQETYNDVGAVEVLYRPTTPPTPPGPSVDSDVVITHWSIIRGRDVKTKKVSVA